MDPRSRPRAPHAPGRSAAAWCGSNATKAASIPRRRSAASANGLRPRDGVFDVMREYTQTKSVWINVDAKIRRSIRDDARRHGPRGPGRVARHPHARRFPAPSSARPTPSPTGQGASSPVRPRARSFAMFVVRGRPAVRLSKRLPALQPAAQLPTRSVHHPRRRDLCSMHFAAVRMSDGVCIDGACPGARSTPCRSRSRRAARCGSPAERIIQVTPCGTARSMDRAGARA